jgi:hypothetical protein
MRRPLIHVLPDIPAHRDQLRVVHAAYNAANHGTEYALRRAYAEIWPIARQESPPWQASTGFRK